MTITVPIVETGPTPTGSVSANAPRRTALVLHGGGGPRTVATIVEHLADDMHVLAPTHPGWDGTVRPESIDSVAALATAYLELLVDRGERDVVLVGSSIGGWLALEMALQAAESPRFAGVVGAVVDIDGVGAVVEGEPLADFFALDARGLAEAAWHDPERGYVDPAGLSEHQRAIQQGNGRTMAAIASDDPELLGKLARIDVPVLVLWGASDRIGTPAYGRVVAAGIPGARFEVVERAGHLPHLERPDVTFERIDAFLS
ncbi:alpha/beta fold hydrolase [Curtobacterium sp. RRHDQ10]|uniref:alpha/beta fold hydrolase n=1 Tax=Curtobacterium phyllosphaerae TaxID=3413379 RepID=UPI003BF39084